MNLSELRQKYPDYNDMSDQEFADAFHGKFYSDIPKEEFYGKIGFSSKTSVEKPKESKRKTTALEDIKLGLFNATKTAGLGFGGLVAPLLPDNQGDAFLDKLHGGVAAMEAWANPKMAEQTFGGKLLGNVATIPAQFAAMPFSSGVKGQDFLDKGESLPRALAAVAIDTVGNVFGAAMPGLGSSLPMKATTTFGGNALQEFVSTSLTQSVAKNKETKEAYKPTFEDAVLAGVTGLPMLAIPSGKKKKVADMPSDKAKAVEADLTPSESIPKPPETIYTDSNGVSRSAPPDAGELAARAAQAKAAEAAGPSPFEQEARRWAESNAADEATVARLEATLAKRNQSRPTMNIDSEGALRSPEELQAANISDAQTSSMQRQQAAQAAIEARQAQMEFDVKRQTALEQQAAMRARQESAPTGYSDYVANRNVEDATRSAEQLQRLNEQLPEGGYKAQQSIVEDFGSNDPMERMPNMRVDENGMPIRADLSMELQNLENPLQRNLWGDELGPALDQTRSLTDAIDSMPAGKERDAAIRMLSGTSTPRRVVPRKQRGAIDASVFEDLYNFGKSVIRGGNGKLLPLYHGSEAEFHNIKASREGGALGNGVYLAVRPEYASSYAEGNGGNVHQVYVDIRKPLVIKGPGDPMVNALVSLGKTREQATAIVEKAYDEKGYITNEVKTLAQRAGYDGIVQYRGEVPSEVVAFAPHQVKSALSPDAKKLGYQVAGKKFEPMDYAGDWEPDGAYDSAYRPVPASQRGGIDLQGVIEGARDLLNKLPGIKPNDPEALAAKATADNIAKKARVNAILGSESGYLENVTTPEAVIALAPNAKDIPRSAAIGGKLVTPGINALAVKHPNPLVKFMRAQTREVFVKTDALVEQYITGRGGIGATIREMSNKEKAEVVQLLQLGDRKQTKITSELMDKHGYSDAQKEFVRKFYEMDAEKLRVWNEKRAQAGMEPVAAREGHVPGIFRGDYKQLVLNAEGKPLGVIAVDFKWQLKAAQEAMSKKFPDAKYTPVKRSSLGGSSGRTGEFGAMQEVLTMLAEKDPSFREVQDLISAAIAENSDKAYGAAQHALRKKGIVGNEGNKPWLDAEQNGADFIKSYLQHWEDQMISHAALPVEKQVRALMENEALDSMPNAKDYVDDYLKGMTGRSVGETGRALNTILDAPQRLFGVGPSGTRAMVHQFNKRMGQYSMGFGNWLFSVTQWLQVAQTGVPEITSAAKQLGVSQAAVIPAMAKAVKDWMAAGTGETKGDFATSMKEARERGLLTFSEFTDVNKITQNKYSRAADRVIDFNRAELGENPTRPLVFFTAVNVLKEAGLTGKQLYDAAYNVTQAGMFDYRMNERPAMYQKMGLAGTLAGGLQTFKHGYMNQMQRMISNGGKDPVSAAYAATALLAYAGIGGMPFYQEADSMFKHITGKFGKEQTISEYALKEVPRWLEKGVISDVTNVNMQSRLSSADVLPNSPIEALSPYFSSIGRMGAAAKDVLSFNDQLAWKNMGVTMTPQGPLKGLAEKSLLTDDEGYVLNREGLRGNTRTQWDKDVRTFSGGRSLDEAMTGENQYNSGQRLKNYRDKQKSIIEQIQRKYVQGELTTEDMQGFAKKYTEAKGDPKQLATQLITFAKTAKLDKQQRLQGIPKSGNLSSLYKFQEYQDDVVKP